MTLYEYIPRESRRHIRLLKLTAIKGDYVKEDWTLDSLLMDLEHFRLDDIELPTYESISYVWADHDSLSHTDGSTTELNSIEVNDERDEANMRTTGSSNSAREVGARREDTVSLIK